MAAFEDEIKGTMLKLSQQVESNRQAEEDEREQRKLFLRGFRDRLQNVILPTLKRAAEAIEDPVKAKVYESDGRVGTLSIDYSGPPLASLSFQANDNQKRVKVMRNSEEQRAVTLEYVTGNFVEESVIKFVESLRA